MVGLRAATAAGMQCLITYTPSTAREDFYGSGAAAIAPRRVRAFVFSPPPTRAPSSQVPDLSAGATTADLFDAAGNVRADLLPAIRDARP